MCNFCTGVKETDSQSLARTDADRIANWLYLSPLFEIASEFFYRGLAERRLA